MFYKCAARGDEMKQRRGESEHERPVLKAAPFEFPLSQDPPRPIAGIILMMSQVADIAVCQIVVII